MYFGKNAPNWEPTENDYRLIFRECADGYWREITNNLAKYSGMILADYLAEMDIAIPDGCQFCRIKLDRMSFEYRCSGAYAQIDVLIV